MNDEFAAIESAMKTLRAHRRDKLAERKRAARTALAQTLDPWLATLDDDTHDRVITEICSQASERNKALITAEYPLKKG